MYTNAKGIMFLLLLLIVPNCVDYSDFSVRIFLLLHKTI